jgi:hypothetical protein
MTELRHNDLLTGMLSDAVFDDFEKLKLGQI